MSKQEQELAVFELRGMISPGDTIYTQLAGVSRSGMTRWLRVFMIGTYKGKPGLWNITWRVAHALGRKSVERNGQEVIRITGVGSDVGFDTVYNLSRKLYEDDTPGDPGYKLIHQWI